jgi:hypothetical protein
MTSELERTESQMQDLDLYMRLSQYLDHFDQHLRGGVGWFIFNAAGPRGQRVATYLQHGFRQVGIPMSYHFVPWRDFSLNAYMVEIELQGFDDQSRQLHGHSEREHKIAAHVSRDSLVRMVATDVLILGGVAPKHRHELDLLDRTIERRYNLRSPTIVITPRMPHELAISFAQVAPEEPFWDRIFGRMYQRSLVAM